MENFQLFQYIIQQGDAEVVRYLLAVSEQDARDRITAEGETAIPALMGNVEISDEVIAALSITLGPVQLTRQADGVTWVPTQP